MYTSAVLIKDKGAIYQGAIETNKGGFAYDLNYRATTLWVKWSLMGRPKQRGQ